MPAFTCGITIRRSTTLRRVGVYFYYDTRLAQETLSLPAPLPARQAIFEAFEWYLQQGIIKPSS